MTTKTPLVVIDEGSAQAKITFEDQGEIKTIVLPSRVEENLKINIQGYSPSSYITPEGEFTVHPELDDVVRTNISTYQTSAANRAIIHESLRLAGFSDQEVKVSVTLPVGRFFVKNGGKSPRDEALIEAKRKNTLADISAADGRKTTKILDCTVYPEAIPALFEISRNDDGSLKEGFLESDKTLVVDIGGATTDISVITSSGDLQDYESIQDCGVLDVSSRLATLIPEETGVRTSLPTAALDQVLRTQKFMRMDVSKIVKKAYIPVLNKIHRQLEKMIHTPALLDKVLIVGGGALLMGEALADKLGVDAIIPEEAESVISRGIFKLERVKHGSASTNQNNH